MGKRAIGKILVCLIAVALCFGFVGVKEVHAATNKVINENTGVSYNTLSAAVAALGSGTNGVTLTVDGEVTETADLITINYNGELTIQGGSAGGSIVKVSDHNIVEDDKIIITENTHIKSLKNLNFKATWQNTPGVKAMSACLPIYIYGTVDEINNVCCQNASYYYSVHFPYDKRHFINCREGGKIGRIINCYASKIDWSGRYEGSYQNEGFYDPICYMMDLFVADGGIVSEIRDSQLRSMSVEGYISNVENVILNSDKGAYKWNALLGSYYDGRSEPNIIVLNGGYIETVKNSYVLSAGIWGTIDTMQGVVSGNFAEYLNPNGMIVIYESGRVNNIIRPFVKYNFNSLNNPSTARFLTCIRNKSEYPVYLEPELNGKDSSEGTGAYMGMIDDCSGTIVWPVSSEGFIYAFPNYQELKGYYDYDKWMAENHPDIIYDPYWEEYDSQGDYIEQPYYDYSGEYAIYVQNEENAYVEKFTGTDGYLHLKLSDVKAPSPAAEPTISKRLVQNGTGILPDMTFGFTFEQLSEWDGVSYVSSTDQNTASSIGEKFVTVTEDDHSTETDPYAGDLTGKKLYKKESENVLSDFVPKVAGTYCYLVKEESSNPIADVTYTGSQFIMLVEVEDSGNGVYKPTKVTNILYKDSAGKTKADYTTPPKVFDEKQELIFYNNYGTTGGTTPTGIMTNILPFIIIGGAGVGGLTLYVVLNVRRKRKENY